MYKIRVNDRIFIIRSKKIITALHLAIIRYLKSLPSKQLIEFYKGKPISVKIIEKKYNYR